MQADVNLKNFSGNPVVEYLSRFWLQGTCSGENDGYGEHDGCHAELGVNRVEKANEV